MGEDDEVARLRRRVQELETTLARDASRMEAILANIPAVLYVKDKALYDAKGQGRDRCVCVEDEHPPASAAWRT